MMAPLNYVTHLLLLRSLAHVYLLARLPYYLLLTVLDPPVLSHSLLSCMNQTESVLAHSHYTHNFSIIGALLLLLLPLGLSPHPLNIIVEMTDMQ